MKPKHSIAFISVAFLCAALAFGVWRIWPHIEPAPNFKGFDEVGSSSTSATNSHATSTDLDAESNKTGDRSGTVSSESAAAAKASHDGMGGVSQTGLTHGGSAKSGSTAALQHAAQPKGAQNGTGGYTALTPEKARDRAEAWSRLFFQAAHVDDATREKLLEAISNSMLEDSEILKTGREQGLSMQEISKLRSENTFKLNQATTEILGPEQGKYFWDVYTSSMFVPLAQDFAARCAAQGVPISASTTEAIAINFAYNLRNPDLPQTRVLGSSGAPVNETMAFQSAAAVLNTTQLDLFKRMWAEHPYPDHPH